jgi:hypothetical protein
MSQPMYHLVDYKAGNNSYVRREFVGYMQAGTTETCGNVVEFALMVVAWSFARIFKCGYLGKLTYSQLVTKYLKMK